MEVEQIEIRNHLQLHPPFDELSEARLDEISRQVEIAYFRAGTRLFSLGDEVSGLHDIRSGAVEIYRRSGEIYNRLGEGDLFGQLALMTGKPARFSVRAIEDTLIYFIPAEMFRTLFDEEETFAEFVEIEDRTRLRQAASEQATASQFMTTRVAKLVRLPPLTIVESASIQKAAEKMAERAASSLIIVSDSVVERESSEIDQGYMTGIVTSDDMVERVLAQGLDHDLPISDVMTRDPISIDSGAFLFEALLIMLRHNVHYVPVLERGRLYGVVDLADVVSLETQNSLFVVRSIFLQNSVAELKALLPNVSASFVRLVNEDANSHMIGSAIAAVGRSFKQRLLELGHEKFGPPPVPYCFLALGSMARDEQIMYSDQDNAMVLHDDFDAKQHGEYFKDLSNFVCDGLAEVGYRYCKVEFEKWIQQPRPEALLHGSVFFDLDGVAGETRMADELKAFVADQASQSPRFLACLARNAQNRTPPLGFFKDFVLEKSGRYQQTINLKRRGTAPLVDVIRVHALASASRAQNSFRRLDDVVAAGFLTTGMAADLRDAMEFISIIRIRHQAAAIEAGRSPDNNIDPENLPSLERRSLKDAFTVLSNAQKFIKFRYRG